MDRVIRTLFPVVLAQCLFQTRQRFDFVSFCAPETLADQFLHDEVHVFQFSLRTPSMILALPLISWFQPYGKCLCEVLCGMRLGIPGVQVKYVIAAAWLWLIPFGIRHSVRTEHVRPARF